MTVEQQRKSWARQVKARRKKVGWTQEKLAAKTPHYSLSYIQKIENAKEGSGEAVAYLLALMASELKTA